MSRYLEEGLIAQGWETIPGPHPIVPLILRDTAKTRQLNNRLFQHGILATALSFPVVPNGDEEIRFQVSASHHRADLDKLLTVLGRA